jgi:hypothetical protein
MFRNALPVLSMRSLPALRRLGNTLPMLTMRSLRALRRIRNTLPMLTMRSLRALRRVRNALPMLTMTSLRALGRIRNTLPMLTMTSLRALGRIRNTLPVLAMTSLRALRRIRNTLPMMEMGPLRALRDRIGARRRSCNRHGYSRHNDHHAEPSHSRFHESAPFSSPPAATLLSRGRFSNQPAGQASHPVNDTRRAAECRRRWWMRWRCLRRCRFEARACERAPQARICALYAANDGFAV